MEIVGPALLSSTQGDSHRTIATDLGLPADTVRGWIRKLTGQAEWLGTTGTVAAHMFDANLPDLLSTQVQSPLAKAIWALGAAAAAARLMFRPIATPWEFLAAITQGQLLAPLRSD